MFDERTTHLRIYTQRSGSGINRHNIRISWPVTICNQPACIIDCSMMSNSHCECILSKLIRVNTYPQYIYTPIYELQKEQWVPTGTTGNSYPQAYYYMPMLIPKASLENLHKSISNLSYAIPDQCFLTDYKLCAGGPQFLPGVNYHSCKTIILPPAA